MTLETLKQQVQSVENAIEAYDEGKTLSLGLDNSMITTALKCSETLASVYPSWCKYLVGYDLVATGNGQVVDKNDLIQCLEDIEDRIDIELANRETIVEQMIYDAKVEKITERRRAYIEGLSDEFQFVEWADWTASDFFMNVYVQEWNPDMELSSTSGEWPEQNPVISEERRAEIQAEWERLGNVDDSEVTIEEPTYVDFSDSYVNDFVIADRDSVVVSFLQGGILAEIFKDRDHSSVLAKIGSVLKGLKSYYEGDASERGKMHSDAIRDVIVRAIPMIFAEVKPDVTSIRDYRFTGPEDEIFKALCDKFAFLADFTYVSQKRFNFTTTIVIDGSDIKTVENMSLFDL